MGDRSLRNYIKGKKEKVQHGFADVLDIPEDVLWDLPKIVIIGNVQLYIENHKGVIEYTSEKLRIGVSSGELVITGKDFYLRNILPDELSIQGRIESLTFNE